MNAQLTLEEYINKMKGSSLGLFTAFNEKYDEQVPFATISVRDATLGDGLNITCNTPEDFLNGLTRTVNAYLGERYTWATKYMIHADKEPAIKFYNGAEVWFSNGVIHNDNGPAMRLKGAEIYCLNGSIIDKELYSDYCYYNNRVKVRNHPPGLRPVFPHAKEILEANKNGLILYCNNDLNYFWYNLYGEVHNPTGPAIERTDGTLEYWEYGKFVRASSMAEDPKYIGIAQQQMEEVRRAVKKALDDALKPKFYTAKDILNSPSWDEMKDLFKFAADRLEDGDTVIEVYDDFAKRYGASFEIDFSEELKENFMELMEEICSHPRNNSWKTEDVNVFARESAYFSSARSVKEDVPQESPKEKTNIEALQENLQRLIDISKKIETAAEETAPEKTPTLIISGSIPTSDIELSNVSIRSNVAMGVAEPSKDVDVSVESSEADLVISQDKDKPETNWGVPLGMLAIAGVVGLLGQKKGTGKSVSLQESVAKNVSQVEMVK